MGTEYICFNPFEWLDMTIQFCSHECVGFGFCSGCWGGLEATLVQVPLVGLPEFDLPAAWNCERLRDIRRLMLDGTPAMCADCPRMFKGCSPPIRRDSIVDPWRLDVLRHRKTETMPRVLNLGYDPSCNLACPQCRPCRYHYGPGNGRYELLKAFQDKTVLPLLKTASRAFLAGYGDPFGSVLYLDLLKSLVPDEFPDLRLSLLTNGIGLTAEIYGSLAIRERIDVVQVSIDAATEETYAQIRGPHWHRLRRNLAFLAELKRQGALAHLEFSFVVQRDNWQEAEAFAEMTSDYGADKAIYYALLNHTHLPGYEDRAVHLPGHPDHCESTAMLARIVEEFPSLHVHVEMPRLP